jgi:hypothetical protein
MLFHWVRNLPQNPTIYGTPLAIVIIPGSQCETKFILIIYPYARSPFAIRQAHHEGLSSNTVRPEPVEGRALYAFQDYFGGVLVLIQKKFLRKT